MSASSDLLGSASTPSQRQAALRNAFLHRNRSLSCQGLLDRLPARIAEPLTWRMFHARQRRQEVADREFDRFFATETAGDVALTAVGLSPAEARRGNGVYRPVWPSVFRDAVLSLPISPDEFTLVDYGSGKGKLMLLAALAGFTEVIGVEYSAELHAAAEGNVRAFASVAGVDATRLHPVHLDATEFVPPDRPLVCTFFNPFDDDTFGQVLQRLEATVAEYRKPAYMVFLHVRTMRERRGVVDALERSTFSKCSLTAHHAVFRSTRGEPGA